METIKLYNGVEMPKLGYGVFMVSPGECERCVSDALSITNKDYFNENVNENFELET